MFSLLSAAGFFLLGWEIVARFEEGRRERWLLRASAAATLAMAMWVGSLWMLALGHLLTPAVLKARTLLVLVAAVALLARRRARLHELFRTTLRPADGLAIGMAIIALGGWVAFVLWRGALVPPLSHDALAYHLPKALLLLRAEGFDSFAYLDFRIRELPINYELVLAEVIGTDGSDRYTEWISTLAYLLFLLAAATLTGRWHQLEGINALTIAVVTASTPILLLHSGADKNDLLTGACMILMLIWGGIWYSGGNIGALVLLMLSTGVAVGTKPQAGVLALCMLPFVGWKLFSEIRAGRVHVRAAAMLAIVGVISFLMLGGVVYLENLSDGSTDSSGSAESVAPYGDWRNLWEGPYVLLAAPFSPHANLLWVPWSDREWFWQRYEIYFSHLGLWFVIAAALLPLARRWSGGRNGERLFATVAGLICFAVMLPVSFHPHGLYAISLPRYAMFLLPLVFGWTLAPFLVRISRKAHGSATALLLVTVVFVVHAVEYGFRDRFVPWDYVLWARRHPGTRVIPFDSRRAASVADVLAPPDEAIAIDAGFGTWIHPAFGANLKRPVEFIPNESGSPRISPNAKWVVIDRSWQVFWGQSRIRDLGDAYRYLGRGVPDAEDVRVLKHLANDRRFELVYYNRRRNQAVFRRVSDALSPP